MSRRPCQEKGRVACFCGYTTTAVTPLCCRTMDNRTRA